MRGAGRVAQAFASFLADCSSWQSLSSLSLVHILALKVALSFLLFLLGVLVYAVPYPPFFDKLWDSWFSAWLLNSLQEGRNPFVMEGEGFAFAEQRCPSVSPSLLPESSCHRVWAGIKSSIQVPVASWLVKPSSEFCHHSTMWQFVVGWGAGILLANGNIQSPYRHDNAPLHQPQASTVERDLKPPMSCLRQRFVIAVNRAEMDLGRRSKSGCNEKSCGLVVSLLIIISRACGLTGKTKFETRYCDPEPASRSYSNISRWEKKARQHIQLPIPSYPSGIPLIEEAGWLFEKLVSFPSSAFDFLLFWLLKLILHSRHGIFHCQV